MPKRIDPDVLKYQRVKKTKPIRAKHISAILADSSMTAKFLLATLEGQQNLSANSMVCIGDDDDVWQQTQDKLLKQYSVTHITPDGWMYCAPKPDAERLAHEVTEEDSLTDFEITAPWGKEQPDGTYLQNGKVGDYILRVIDDPIDRYIVEKKIFKRTYEYVQVDQGGPAPRFSTVEPGLGRSA